MTGEDRVTAAESGPVWPRSPLSAEDLIPDAALRSADRDDLDHDAVAAVLSDLARSVEPPANIALFGPWGSGKSSVFAMLRDRLALVDASVKVVRYDAWKFGGRSLQRNFLVQVAESLGVARATFLSNVHSATERTRLRLGRYLWRNKSSLLGAGLLAVLVSAAWLLVSSWVRANSTSIGFGKAVSAAIPGAGIVLGAVIAGLLLSNQTLATAVEKRTRSPLEDADEFSTAFDELIKWVTRKPTLWRDWFLPAMKDPRLIRGSGGSGRPRRVKRLVVFIDELDRCDPKDVAQTLVDLKTSWTTSVVCSSSRQTRRCWSLR